MNYIRAGHPDASCHIKAVVAPYTPQRLTRHVNFTTRGKHHTSVRFLQQILETNPEGCHVNRAA